MNTVILSSLVVFLASNLLWAAPKKGLYVAVGDSITAGAVAETWSPRSLRAPASLSQGSKTYPLPQTSRSTQRFSTEDLHGLIESRYGYSWATGYNINSYYKKLKATGRFQIPQVSWSAYNVAITGQTFDSLPKQFADLKAKFEEMKPDYLHVTLFLGSNDLCNYQGPMSTFQTQSLEVQLRQFMEKLDQLPLQSEKKLVVVNLLRIPDLNEDKFLNAKAFLAVTCRDVRQLLRTCPYLTHWNTITEKALAQIEVDRVNDMLNLAPKFNYPTLQTHVANGIKDLQFEPQDIAMDCFHPGKTGQQAIADQIWKTKGF